MQSNNSSSNNNNNSSDNSFTEIDNSLPPDPVIPDYGPDDENNWIYGERTIPSYEEDDYNDYTTPSDPDYSVDNSTSTNIDLNVAYDTQTKEVNLIWNYRENTEKFTLHYMDAATSLIHSIEIPGHYTWYTWYDGSFPPGAKIGFQLEWINSARGLSYQTGWKYVQIPGTYEDLNRTYYPDYSYEDDYTYNYQEAYYPQYDAHAVLLQDRAFQYSKASDWALDAVISMNDKNLIDDTLKKNYTKQITRLEFTQMVYFALESKVGGYIPNYMYEKYGDENIYTPFDDVQDPPGAYTQYYTGALNKLGIVNGISSDRFNPNGYITRQEAATMLNRLFMLLMYGDATSTTNYINDFQTFSDQRSVASWASVAVNNMQALKIMSGTGNNNFSPNATYTVEQSIVSLHRLLTSYSF
jgi:hypothetical protein